jgi:hypothetical protein
MLTTIRRTAPVETVRLLSADQTVLTGAVNSTTTAKIRLLLEPVIVLAPRRTRTATARPTLK